MPKTILTHRKLLEQIGKNQDIAEILGVHFSSVSHWRASGIPMNQWVPVAMLAQKRAIPVTAEEIARAAPARLRKRLPRIS